jgi:hypothetical protein
MTDTDQSFTFVDAGRTFACRVEAARAPRAGAWWWFEVSTERHARHAPFRAEPGDTADDVRARVVAYYDDLLARRAAPPQSHWQRRGAPAPAAAAAAPAAAPPA